jgi:hypothetical protein
MNKESKDQGAILMLLERFNTQRLPRTLEMKKRVDRGEPLIDLDHAFLEEVLGDAQNIQPLIGKHPEYQEIYLKAITLCKEIIDKDMANQKKSLK